MTSQEFLRWKIYLKITDHERQDDLRMAVLCSLLQNLWSKKGSDPKDHLAFIQTVRQELFLPARPASPKTLLQQAKERNEAVMSGLDAWFRVWDRE
jgi:hypothetical protein